VSVPSPQVHGLELLVGKPVHMCISTQITKIRDSHLHKHLQIITSPLLEVLAFREALKPSEGWSKHYATRNSAIIPLSTKSRNLPSINIVKNLLCFCCWVFCLDVIIDPHNKVVLEGTFYQLVQ
jgi:hypothetical protein